MSDTVQPQPTKVLEESPGVKSSKRYFGAALIAAGGLLLLAVGVVAIFIKVADPETALAAGRALIITGAALLGVTVVEGISSLIAKSRAAKYYDDAGEGSYARSERPATEGEK